MTRLIAFALILPSLAIGGPYAKAKCKSGTPLPTECRCIKNGTALPVTAPITAAGETACYADLAGSGTITLSCVAANAWGSAPAQLGTFNAADYQAPGQLEAFTVVPALP